MSSCTSNKVYFTGYDIFHPELNNFGGTMSIGVGEVKKGWRITGVVYKTVRYEKNSVFYNNIITISCV